MAAKTGAKPAVKAAGAKPAAAPKAPEAVEKSAAAPGAGGPAGSTGSTGSSGSAATGESDSERAAREQLFSDLVDEAEQLNREWDENAAQVLNERMALLEDEARAMDAEFNELSLLEGEAWAMDAERTESLKTTQTTAEEASDSAVTLDVWALPEIGEFPATVVLENHTRNRVGVPGANVALDPYERVEVTVSLEQFAKLAKSLTSSARAHKWDNLKGLQVKYDRKD